MNAQQEARFTMFKAVDQHFDDNTGIVATVAAFSDAAADLKTVISQITGMVQLVVSPITGIADDKESSKQTLAQLGADLASLVSAFATVTGSNEIKQKVDFTYNVLLRTTDDELGPRCQDIHDIATANSAALVDYGVTHTNITALQDAIDAFVAFSPKPRVAISNRKTYSADLEALLDQGNTIVRERLDKLAPALQADNPDFVSTYRSVRIIIDPSTTPTQIKGTVTAAATGLPVAAANVEITSTNKFGPTTTLSTTTAADGKYNIKPVPIGQYTVTVTAPGYTDQVTTNIDLKLGQITHLNVAMEIV